MYNLFNVDIDIKLNNYFNNFISKLFIINK